MLESPPFYGMAEASAIRDPDLARRLEAELEKLGEAALDRIEAIVGESGVALGRAVRKGAPVDEIIAEAEAWGADVIVTSTHGRSGLVRMLLGSVANQLVNRAPCPVLLARVGSGR